MYVYVCMYVCMHVCVCMYVCMSPGKSEELQSVPSVRTPSDRGLRLPKPGSSPVYVHVCMHTGRCGCMYAWRTQRAEAVVELDVIESVLGVGDGDGGNGRVVDAHPLNLAAYTLKEARK